MVYMKKLIIGCSLILLFSCNRAEKEGATKVTLNLPSSWGISSKESGAISTQSLNSSIVPTSLADLNCFVVLVGGDDLKRNTCGYKNSSVTYPVGRVLGGFYNAGGASGTQISFDVESGDNRSIYLVGFKVDISSASPAMVAKGITASTVCSKFISDPCLENFISEPYMIATEKGVKMVAGESLSVDMTATLDTSNRVGDCTGDDFPKLSCNDGIKGVPYKFGISFQDDLGGVAHPLGPDKCIGVRFQIQDAYGNRASVPSTANYAGKVNMNYLGNAIGTFYHANSTIGCASGTEMSIGSNDMTVAFSNNGSAFSDFVAFFSPSNAQSPTGTLQIAFSSDGSAATPLLNGSTTFYFGTSTPAVKYAIYDLYNNRSTSSTTNLNPMVIRVNECREGYLQFQDANGVPTKLSLSSGTFKDIEVAPQGTTSNLTLYSSSSDCSSGNSFVYSRSIAQPQLSNNASYMFYYKMAIPLTTFSFSALNTSGTSTPAITSGDLNSGSNFWQSVNSN